MERKIVNNLLLWKNNPDKQPLLLQWACQVGKTYILLSFGKAHYKNVAYFIWVLNRLLSGGSVLFPPLQAKTTWLASFADIRE